MTGVHSCRALRSSLSLLVVAVVAGACGGGGSGPTAPTLASAADVEYQSFQLINSARQQNGVQPMLDLDELVSSVARAHSESMRDNGFFGHEGPAGGLTARLRGGGVAAAAAAENVARVDSMADPASAAHSEFLASPSHRANMLNDRWQLAGVGVAQSGNTYWLTQIYVRQ